MSHPIDLSPQERLAISRRAIVRYMNRHHPEVPGKLETQGEGEGQAEIRTDRPSNHGKFSQIKYAASMWWHRHPASAVADLASPLLDSYSKAHPFKLLGISAIVGAALVIVRPWRMISGSALLIAAIKSSGLSNTLLTMLSSLTHHSDDTDISL